MNNNSETSGTPLLSPLEAIRRESDDHTEYWSARELAKVLSYNDYRNFLKVVTKARIACQNSEQSEEDHFVDVTAMVKIGSGAIRKIEDVYLSRYACY